MSDTSDDESDNSSEDYNSELQIDNWNTFQNIEGIAKPRVKLVKKTDILVIDSLNRLSDKMTGHMSNFAVKMSGKPIFTASKYDKIDEEKYTGILKVYNNIVTVKILNITIPHLISSTVANYHFFDDINNYFLEIENFYSTIISNNNTYIKKFCHLIPVNRHLPKKKEDLNIPAQLGYIDLEPLDKEGIHFDIPLSTFKTNFKLKLTDDNNNIIYESINDFINIKFIDVLKKVGDKWNYVSDNNINFTTTTYFSDDFLINDKIKTQFVTRTEDIGEAKNRVLYNGYFNAFFRFYSELVAKKNRIPVSLLIEKIQLDILYQLLLLYDHYLRRTSLLNRIEEVSNINNPTSKLKNTVSSKLPKEINQNDGTIKYYPNRTIDIPKYWNVYKDELYHEYFVVDSKKNIEQNNEKTDGKEPTINEGLSLSFDAFPRILTVLQNCYQDTEMDYEILIKRNNQFFKVNYGNINIGNMFPDANNLPFVIKNSSIVIKGTELISTYDTIITRLTTLIQNINTKITEEKISLFENNPINPVVNDTNTEELPVSKLSEQDKLDMINYFFDFESGEGGNYVISFMKVISLLINKYILPLYLINESRRALYTFEIGYLVPDTIDITKNNNYL